jgi:uncharacterized protein (DUF486 family)
VYPRFRIGYQNLIAGAKEKMYEVITAILLFEQK